MMKYDSILYLENDWVNEAAVDPRLFAKRIPGDDGGFTQYFNADDPRMHTQYNFGNALRNQLTSLSNGFSAEVVDFKKWVTVRVTHSNHLTGKSASKTFLIVFQHKGDGIVLSTHNKYRSISGVDQAATYIRNACNALSNETSNKIG